MAHLRRAAVVVELLVESTETRPPVARAPHALRHERAPWQEESDDGGLYTECSGLMWKRSGTDTTWNHKGLYSNGFRAYSIEYALNPFEYPVVGSGARVLYLATCKKVRIYRHC